MKVLSSASSKKAITEVRQFILIVVAVALETMRQVDSQLTVREYEGIE